MKLVPYKKISHKVKSSEDLKGLPDIIPGLDLYEITINPEILDSLNILFTTHKIHSLRLKLTLTELSSTQLDLLLSLIINIESLQSLKLLLYKDVELLTHEYKAAISNTSLFIQRLIKNNKFEFCFNILNYQALESLIETIQNRGDPSQLFPIQVMLPDNLFNSSTMLFENLLLSNIKHLSVICFNASKFLDSAILQLKNYSPYQLQIKSLYLESDLLLHSHIARLQDIINEKLYLNNLTIYITEPISSVDLLPSNTIEVILNLLRVIKLTKFKLKINYHASNPLIENTIQNIKNLATNVLKNNHTLLSFRIIIYNMSKIYDFSSIPPLQENREVFNKYYNYIIKNNSDVKSISLSHHNLNLFKNQLTTIYQFIPNFEITVNKSDIQKVTQFQIENYHYSRGICKKAKGLFSSLPQEIREIVIRYIIAHETHTYYIQKQSQPQIEPKDSNTRVKADDTRNTLPPPAQNLQRAPAGIRNASSHHPQNPERAPDSNSVFNRTLFNKAIILGISITLIMLVYAFKTHQSTSPSFKACLKAVTKRLFKDIQEASYKSV